MRDEHGGGAAVGGRAALQLGERLVDHRRFHDLLERVDVLELRVGVALRVLVVDTCDFGEVFGFGAEPVVIVSEKWRGGEGEGREDILLHVFPPCVAKHLCCSWCIRDSPCSSHHLSARARRIRSVVPETLQRAGIHLLESHNQNTIRASMANNISREMKTCRAGRAVVIDVVDGDLGHAKLVEYTLPAG